MFNCDSNFGVLRPYFRLINFSRLHVYEILPSDAKIFILTILVLCSSSIVSLAQSREDSLAALVQTRKGAGRITPMIELARVYANSNRFDLALPYVIEAQKLAYEEGDSAQYVRSGRIRGQILNRLERVKEASEVLIEILPVAKRNNYRADYKIILNNLAGAYAFQARYDEALRLHFETLQMREADNELEEISASLNNIGVNV